MSAALTWHVCCSSIRCSSPISITTSSLTPTSLIWSLTVCRVASSRDFASKNGCFSTIFISLSALLPAWLEQLADQVLQRELVLSLVLALGEPAERRLALLPVPASELAQVGLGDGVVLVGVPQRLAGAEVEEHHAKGPQVIGDIGLVHVELLLVHQHAGAGVGCLEKDLGHLGRAVAAAG
eukprot:scaffold21174_cov52-Phaeocystis_antarctica.AAC.4